MGAKTRRWPKAAPAADDQSGWKANISKGSLRPFRSAKGVWQLRALAYLDRCTMIRVVGERTGMGLAYA